MANEKIEGQPCQDCETGTYVKNPKTQKIFCDQKCWLNNQQQLPKQSEPDWEKISIGKVRHGVTCAYIQAGMKTLDAGTAKEIQKIVKFIMIGEHPDVPFTE